MDTTITIDLGQVARELNLPVASVQRTLELLDEGNTVPFITRYRKDLTGALDDEQIREVQAKVAKLRALSERKQTILKSIEAQGKLTPELARDITHASSTKRLEDLYLPYKPKKQTLATLARQRGLEPLAVQILSGELATDQLETRAAEFINEAHDLRTATEVLAGVRHLLAERYSERVDLRDRLRRFLRQTGKLVVNRVETAEPSRAAAPPAPKREATPSGTAPAAAPENATPPAAPEIAPSGTASEVSAPEAGAEQTSIAVSLPSAEAAPPAPLTRVPQPPAGGPSEAETPAAETEPLAPRPEASDVAPAGPAGEPAGAEFAPQASDASAAAPTESPAAESPAAETAESPSAAEAAAAPAPPSPAVGPVAAPPAAAPPSSRGGAKARTAAEKRAQARTAKKQKKRQKLESAFKDYFQFSEPLTRVPPHRILAINRGERARILRVKLELDHEALFQSAAQAAIPEDHPQREFLLGCLRDALQRLIVPSLEREARRELTEAAEQHALDVFVRNLRKLLLQPPVRGRRVLAVDPGFRSGCKLIALDEFGNVLGHDLIHVVGRDERKQDARAKLAHMIRQFHLGVIAIGNGTGCRETEQLVAEVLGDELKDLDGAYVVVNEAGASVYSTSPLGREELPDYDPILRSAISIGRRLLDPLSELVKINPANIGVGLYQHDVKAKHLRDSLDAVVESCVNFVGVDVNTASPALLRYVSGLNQLTARRVYEHRRQHGPFRNREQFKDVPGFGDATFVQAAGFLKIPDGDNPLDATWIHPESYAIAERVLERLGADVEDVRAASPRPARPPATATPAPSPEAAAAEMTGATVSAESAAPAESAEPVASTEPVASAEPVASGPVEAAEPVEAVELEPAPSAVQESAHGIVVDSEVEAAASGSERAPLAEIAAAEDVAVHVPAAEAALAQPSPVALEALPPEKDAETMAREAAAEQERRAAARAALSDKASRVEAPTLAAELGVGELMLRDILASLTRPGRDPRDDLPQPVFRRGIMKLEDLKPGMELTGTVLNVVDFGAFVDIGLAESGLIHISRLADRYVRDPHEVVGVGDPIKVWVIEVDKDRRRVSLTAVPPGQERKRPEPARKPAAQAGDRPPAAPRPPRAQPQQRPPRGGGRPPRAAKGRSWVQKSSLPAKPLTKAMEEGKEPLRSFSDLLQFYEKKQHGDDEEATHE